MGIFQQLFPDIEDQDNWHGKPLGGKTDDLVKAISDNIVNKGQHQLCPKSPEKDLPVVPFGGLKLDSPPDYKLGDKVYNC